MEVNKIGTNQAGREDVKNPLINKSEVPASAKSQQNFTQMLETLRGSERASSIISNIQGESSASVSGLKTGNSEALFDTRLPGDILKSMKIENPVPADTHREVQGIASSFGKSGETVHSRYSIDRTSKLYEQALEFESYFVKSVFPPLHLKVPDRFDRRGRSLRFWSCCGRAHHTSCLGTSCLQKIRLLQEFFPSKYSA